MRNVMVYMALLKGEEKELSEWGGKVPKVSGRDIGIIIQGEDLKKIGNVDMVKVKTRETNRRLMKLFEEYAEENKFYDEFL
jgi:hypothetical protein